MNIILVHGILGFREKFGVEYFNGVKESLESPSRKVLVPQLDATGTIRKRGEQLRGQIWEAFRRGLLDPDAGTHIIAHSQGGLDSRFMLSPKNPNTTRENDLSGKITSLTTIGSPHQGSPIADLLAGKPFDRTFKGLESILDSRGLGQDIVRALLSRLGINPEALTDLDTASMAEFNRDYPDHPGVHYFSIAGKGRPGIQPTCLFLLEFHHHIRSVTGEDNDGLVAVSSAERWGSGWPAWPADHADEIGHNLDSIELKPLAGFDYLEEYAAIVERVSAL